MAFTPVRYTVYTTSCLYDMMILSKPSREISLLVWLYGCKTGWNRIIWLYLKPADLDLQSFYISVFYQILVIEGWSVECEQS